MAGAYALYDDRGLLIGIPRQGTIYFLRPQGSDAVKIGWTTALQKRIARLQCGNPQKLELLATFTGSRGDEANLHSRFAASKVRLEWFTLTPELQAYIDGLRGEEKAA